MAKGIKAVTKTASRDIGYARQISKDVQKEKLNEPHTRPPDGKTNSPKTLVGTNCEDTPVDGVENSDSNEKRPKQRADQFHNDLSTSVISNRSSREIQHVMPTGSHKPEDGMNQYLLESMSAGESPKPPGCNPKQLADNVTDEEETLTGRFGIFNFNLSKLVEVEHVNDATSLENDATETDTKCYDGFEVVIEDSLKSSSNDTGILQVNLPGDTDSLENQCIAVRPGDDSGFLDSHSIDMTSCDDNGSIDNQHIAVTPGDDSGFLDIHSVEVTSFGDNGSLESQCLKVTSNMTSCDDSGSLDSQCLKVTSKVISCDDNVSLDSQFVKASKRDYTGSLDNKSIQVKNQHSLGIDGNICHVNNKKEIQIAEVKSQDNGERFIPDAYQTQNEHSLQPKNKNMCPSGKPAAGSGGIDFKQLGIDQHNERLGKKCNFFASQLAFHKHDDFENKSSKTNYTAYLEKHKQSVGYIQRNGSQIGTCFRVGPKEVGLVITAYHVFYDLYRLQNKIPADNNLFELSHLSIRVCFPDWEKDDPWYIFKPVFHNGCPKLDYVLLELEGSEFPEPFQDFGRVCEDRSNFLHSYQDSILEIDNRVKILNATEELVNQATYHCEAYNFYEPYSHIVSDVIRHSVLDNEKVPILTELRHGASGSPGLHMNDEGSAVVAYVYLRGYPHQYYTFPKDELDRSTFPACLLVEQGLKIVAIYDSLHSADSDLAKSVFPSIDIDLTSD